MTKGGKPKRAGTRGGTNVGKRPRPPLPDDLPDAAEAALDDLLTSSHLRELADEDEAPARGLSTAEVSLEDLIPLEVADDGDDDEPLTRHRPRRLPSKVAPLEKAAPAYTPPPSARATPVPSTRPSAPASTTTSTSVASRSPLAPAPDADDGDPLDRTENVESVELPTNRAASGGDEPPQRPSGFMTGKLPTVGSGPTTKSGPHTMPRREQSGPFTIPRRDVGARGRSPDALDRALDDIDEPPTSLAGSRGAPRGVSEPYAEMHTRPASRGASQVGRALSEPYADIESAPFPLPEIESAPHPLPDLDSGRVRSRNKSQPISIADDAVPDLDSRPFARPGRNRLTPSTPVRVVTSEPVDDDQQLVEERIIPELQPLRFAIYEDSAYLMSAQTAVTEAGHVVAIAGAGRDGITRVTNAIKQGTIDVVIVSLPGGEPVVDATRSFESKRPTVIASLSASSVEAVSTANVAGADLATTRPHDVERIALLALAAQRLDAERRIAISAKGAEQVLRQRLDDLADAEPGGLLPFEMFQRVLELEIKRAKRFEYPLSVALFAVEIAPPPPPAGIRGILRARAGNALINTIRDIDIATQLDHERFLVLLPYTDLKGAANVGRRVIAAVGQGVPVVSDGRSFPPRVVGAVAGMKKGEPVSFAKLMKDATRALEQARRDGAELAVQP